MLKLRKIIKDYDTGDSSVRALNGVSLDFRKNEFVSILGPSGCGKTTLLNIIGGLDQYTSGDLIINGVSTKFYKDADWDTYRNHSIGFVFQSYNLIPHQTVLANVELALTLSGISKRERRARAIDALRQVGLAGQMKKRPNQMSGGQMQRVAIARALVNDPDILLADEPTGALDTHTSVQIMNILRSISRKKLIIMVTHNPDLARQYSTRIIKVLDGRVVSDSNPYNAAAERERKPAIVQIGERKVLAKAKTNAIRSTQYKKGGKKRSMSFFTALSLSLNNLMTKKARTFMTSFAGSIGIIGIALILSVSTGVNNYINAVQRDTLASYPIQIDAESMDMTSLVTSLMSAGSDDKKDRPLDKVYESAVIAKLMNSLNSTKVNTNDLKAFKEYLESTDEFDPYATAIQYSYLFDWNILTKDAEGTVIKSDVMELFEAMSGMNNNSVMGGMSSSTSGAMASSFNVWQEMLDGTDGELVNKLIKDEYDLIHGTWPNAYNEVVLVVDDQNEISDLSLYALGLRTKAEIVDAMMAATKGEQLDTANTKSWSYEEICAMQFKLILASDSYAKQVDGTYSDMTASTDKLNYLYNNSGLGIDLKIVGIIRPNPDATSTVLTGTIAYTTALTDYVIEKTASSQLLREQIETPTVDVLTGLPFPDPNAEELTPAEKKAAVVAHIGKLSTMEQVAFYTKFATVPTEEQVAAGVMQMMASMTPEQIDQTAVSALVAMLGISEQEAAAQVAALSNEDKTMLVSAALAAVFTEQFVAAETARLTAMTPDMILAEMQGRMSAMTDDEYVNLYENYLPAQYSDSTYEDNLELLGYVDAASPDSIRFYAETFEDKDEIAKLIQAYNDRVEEGKQINYTDYVALLMSSVTTIVNAISYVLIAFVAISLVVSSIMIGIITYISVLERTKEIGILRAIGASKKDIRRVFNAETLIVGFVAGMIGILATLGLNVVINIILFNLTGIASLKAELPIIGAVLLVAISMFLTFIAGLFPSSFAAKRNPVEALRTE